MAKTRTEYTKEYRQECADYVIKSGRPVPEIAEELGLNVSTLGGWVTRRKKALNGADPDEGVTIDPELKKAQKRIRELEMEVEFLKKAAAFFAKDQL